MSEFPHLDHIAVKLVFDKDCVIDKALVGGLVGKIVEGLQLTILREVDHDFPGGGLTCVLILSQSHLVCHTWPEYGFIHIDLMTCSPGLKFDLLRPILEKFSPEELLIQELKY